LPTKGGDGGIEGVWCFDVDGVPGFKVGDLQRGQRGGRKNGARPSWDRRVLALKFPVSGKFTGNSPFFGSHATAAAEKRPLFQYLAEEFPAARNRELNSHIRESRSLKQGSGVSVH